MCGHNGETYSSECAALADRTTVDYLGPCRAFGLITGIIFLGERSGSVVECLIQDRGAASSNHHWRHCVVSLSKTH